MNLYELTGQYLEVQKMIDEGVPVEQLADTLDGIEAGLEEKAGNILYLINNALGDIGKIKAEEKRLADKRKSLDGQVVRLKEYLIENMKAQNNLKIDNGVIKCSIIKPKPMLVLTDENLVPDSFKKITVSSAIDKKQLLSYLKELPEGEVVEGASIGKTKHSISIK